MRTLYILLLAFVTSFGLTAQEKPQEKVWQKDQLMATQDLAIKIKLNSKDKPLIFNVGPMDNIKGATQVGLGTAVTFGQRMQGILSMENKTKPIVVYCGCCSYSNCPNIRPAYDALMAQGFKNTKVLELPVTLKQDWIDLGYPMEK